MNESFLNAGNWQTKIPYVKVANEAFPLSTNSMKPYFQKNLGVSDRLFHYCLSRTRRTAESGFGILLSRFRIFYTKIYLLPENAAVCYMIYSEHYQIIPMLLSAMSKIMTN